MIDAELKIARFTDGVMLPDEKNAFLAEIHTDAELREALETENTILTAIGTDAAAIEHTMMFDTAPGAPLVERLAATAVSSRKIVYYLIGAAAILTLVALLLFRSEPQAPGPSLSPLPKQIEQAIPEPAPASNAAHRNPETQVREKAKAGKGSAEEKTSSKTQKEIDLDQDLKGNNPKVFTDPKGHMPIK